MLLIHLPALLAPVHVPNNMDFYDYCESGASSPNYFSAAMSDINMIDTFGGRGCSSVALPENHPMY